MAQAEREINAALVCGVCGDPAEVVATVPMCRERPRYPMCHDCFEPIEWCGYAEDVVILTPPTVSVPTRDPKAGGGT